METELNYIGGAWRGAERTLDRENPSQPDELVQTYPNSDSATYHEAIRAAAAAFPAWKRMPIINRARIFQAAARQLEGQIEPIARDIVREVGKPITEARGEVRRAVDLLDYYAGYAWHPQGMVVPSSRPQTELRAVRAPLGVVAMITPWNFPIAIPTWKLAPALIMGNTVVLKPSEMGGLGAIHLVRALEAAGLPAGVVNLVHGPGAPFSEALIETELVKAVSFTGSAAVGAQIKRNLADKNIRIQLELGSKNPFIVWQDADLADAVKLVIESAFSYGGQKCTATSRVLIHEQVYGSFTDQLVTALADITPSDPLEPATRIGPLISARSQQNVARWLASGVDSGGRILFGGEAPKRAGYFFNPTVLEGVPLDAPLAQEEVFGPLITLHPVASIDEAIEAANATRFGLAASIATTSLSAAQRFFDGVEAGLLHVNQPTAGVEYQIPFGGTRGSGFGPKEQGWSALDFYADWRSQIVRTW